MYIVSEIQTNKDGVVGILNTQHENYNDAESKYHLVLSYAAKSGLPCHAAVIMTNEGMVMANQYYKHEEETNE